MNKIIKNNLLSLPIIILGLIYIFSSDGFYFIDEIGQYSYSRMFFYDPFLALDVWTRFGRILLFAPITYFGLIPTKIFGFVLFLILIIITKKVCNELSIKNNELIWILLGLQPVIFDVSYTCLAEIPTLVVMLSSYYYFLRNRYATAIILSSLIIWFRNETLLFSLTLIISFIYEKKWRYLPLFLIGPVIYWLYSFLLTNDVSFLLKEMQRYSQIPKYKTGTEISYYLLSFPSIFNFMVTVLFILGLFLAKNRLTGINRIIVLGSIFLIIIFDTIASSQIFNFSGSVGDNRYLTQIAPFVSIISLIGLNKIIEKYPSYKWIFSNIILFFSILIILGENIPHKISDYEDKIITLIKSSQNIDPNKTIFCNHFIADHYFNLPYNNPGKILRFEKIPQTNDIHGFYIWDSLFCSGIINKNKISSTDMKTNKLITIVDSVKYQNYWFYLFADKNNIKKGIDESRLNSFYNWKAVKNKILFD